MARGVNRVIILGNLGGDPDVRYLPNGDAVANITVATSESWTDKQTGEKREATEWHRVVFFRKLAEIVGQYLTKGSKVYIEGSLKTRKYQDNNGQDRYITEIRGSEMQMLDSAQSGNGQANNQGGYQQQAQQPQRQQPQQYGNVQQQPQRNQRPPANNGYAQAQNQPPVDDFDSEIPF